MLYFAEYVNVIWSDEQDIQFQYMFSIDTDLSLQSLLSSIDRLYPILLAGKDWDMSVNQFESATRELQSAKVEYRSTVHDTIL